ncbi:EamA family transporter [Candidatus Woesearchaeota archaeon]|jgi:bacterial/archaeal transporter family protein|nr:EamA family transporter [Candidatus Woesearchaeota archaeon]MBT4387939.1 EamA family transporter [Candidatus Woesearchaeota archaeon]MBT4595757.1 EamA family transporter [Candidatus Woesearchaeota archaeon]MBT5741394.1 EamA family transporter [Candidatus Woesearchaeota archaeon]MBT6505216.1 EamA family transporter [Candidatus Woesearchaeota archaeon]
MNSWYFFSLITLLIWGVGSFLPKISTNYISPKSALMFEVIGTLILGLIVFFFNKESIDFNYIGSNVAIIAGFLGILGSFTFLLALKKGNANTTIAITSLYPLLAILLSSFFFKEALKINHIFGIVFSIIAIYLFSF